MLLDAPKALWRWAFLYIVSNKHSFALSVDHVGNIWGARKLCISYLVSGFLPHWFRLNFCLKIFKITLISLLIPSIISSSFIIFITVFDSTLCSQESVYFNLYHSQIWLSELKLESPFLYNCFSKGQEIFTVYLLISIYLHKPNNSPRKNKMGQGEKINELWVWCNWGWNILAKISIFFSKKEIEYTTVLQIFEITWSMSESPYFFNSFALYDLIFSFCDFVFIYYKK